MPGHDKEARATRELPVLRREETAAGDGWLLALLAALATGYAVLTRPPGPRLADLDVYLGAVAGLRDGDSLYDFILVDAPFTYPPFAGLVLAPITAVPKPALQVLWTLATVVAVVMIARIAGGRNAPGAALVLFLSAPVSSDLRYGQVSLFLALAVLIGVRRGGGVLIGLAAAIKLTPLIFVPMLWLAGRRRAARAAAGTFVACAVLAALLLTADSWRYWTGEVRDVRRLGHIGSIGNQSLNGALIRAGLGPEQRQVLVVLVGGLVVLLAWRRARRLFAAGDPLAGTIVVGAASVVLSPVSWTHHQVWLVLAVLLPGHRAVRAAGLAVMVLPAFGDTRLLWAAAVAAVIPYGGGRADQRGADGGGPPAERGSSRFTILPVALRGSSGRNTTSRGTQKRARCRRTCARIWSASGVAPSCSTR